MCEGEKKNGISHEHSNLVFPFLFFFYFVYFGIVTRRKVSENGKRVFRTLAGDRKGGDRGDEGGAKEGPGQGWEGQEVTTPYPVSSLFEEKRLLAQVNTQA